MKRTMGMHLTARCEVETVSHSLESDFILQNENKEDGVVSFQVDDDGQFLFRRK